MPRATLKLTPQLKPSKNYTSRSNHYMQLHAESSQSSFLSRNLSSLLGKLNCGKCWLSSWFNKFNSGNKLCKSATCCNSSLVFFPFLKRAGQDLAQTDTVMNVKNTKKNLENLFTCREMLAMLPVVVQLETVEDWKT